MVFSLMMIMMTMMIVLIVMIVMNLPQGPRLIMNQKFTLKDLVLEFEEIHKDWGDQLSCFCPGWLLCWSSRVATHSRRFPGSPMRRSTSRWRRRAGQRPGETWVSIQRKLLHSRVDKAEECDRQKCPKMMDLCKDGGHCYGQCSFPSLFLIRCLQLLGTVEMTVVFAT